MRISKAALLILGIGIFVIAMGGLFMVYRGQASEQKILNDRLTTAQNNLPPLISEKEDLESQLTTLEDAVAEAELSLFQAKTIFPNTVESIEYDELLFSIADDWNLEIIRLIASEPGIIEVEKIPFKATSFTISIKGETEDILTYINTIVNHSSFISATAELVNIEVPEPLSDQEKGELTEEELDEREDIDKPLATIRLIIYGYKGE